KAPALPPPDCPSPDVPVRQESTASVPGKTPDLKPALYPALFQQRHKSHPSAPEKTVPKRRLPAPWFPGCFLPRRHRLRPALHPIKLPPAAPVHPFPVSPEQVCVFPPHSLLQFPSPEVS